MICRKAVHVMGLVSGPLTLLDVLVLRQRQTHVLVETEYNIWFHPLPCTRPMMPSSTWWSSNGSAAHDDMIAEAWYDR